MRMRDENNIEIEFGAVFRMINKYPFPYYILIL